METSSTSIAPEIRERHLYATGEAKSHSAQRLAEVQAVQGQGQWSSSLERTGIQPANLVTRILKVLCVLMITLGFASMAACSPHVPNVPGSYTTVITPDDIPAGFGSTDVAPEDIAFLSGTWQMDFISDNHSDGNFTMSKDGEEMMVSGHYRLTSNTIVFSDETGPGACDDDSRQNYLSGTYRFGHSGDELAFLAVDDKCGGRGIVLGTQPWLKLR